MQQHSNQSITTAWLSIGEKQYSNQSITTAWLSIGEQQHSDQSITTAWLNIGEQQHSNQSITTAWKGGLDHFSRKLYIFFVTSHNFFSLSSVQIIIIPACCLLCVL